MSGSRLRLLREEAARKLAERQARQPSKPPRDISEEEDEQGRWQVQRDPDTGEEIVRVLLEPAPAFEQALRLAAIEAQLPDAQAVIDKVDRVEQTSDIAVLRAEIVRMMKRDLQYNRAVAVKQEYDDLTKEDDPRPGVGRIG